MVTPFNSVRRIVLLFLIGLAIVLGISVFHAATAAESGHSGSNPLQPIANNELTAPPAPPELAFVPLPANAPQKHAISTQAVSDVTRQSKSIAIDSDPNAGNVESSIMEMDSVRMAAQMWANASFPVEQFQAYTSPFGYRQSPSGGYRQEFHYGLDIAAPSRSNIRNWWSGTIIEVSDGGSCGTSAVIQSGEWVHIYCHMQGHVETHNGTPVLIDREGDVQLWQGQQIFAGDRIGRVGMTGRTTGPHLHWGLKYQGNWVDPAWVLQAMVASHQTLYGQQ